MKKNKFRGYDKKFEQGSTVVVFLSFCVFSELCRCSQHFLHGNKCQNLQQCGTTICDHGI